jgi:diguanylate cyclase (GGDEF)-like protein
MSPSTTLLTSYIVQAAGALITAVLFGFFSRTYRRPFLLHWARAWSAMCIMLMGAALSASVTDEPLSMSRLSVAAVTAIAGYLQVVWLLFGAVELVSTERAAKLQAQRAWIFAAAIVAGLISFVLFASHPEFSGTQYFVRVGLRASTTGIAFLIAAVCVRWSRSEKAKRSLGRALVGGAFLVYAFTQLHRTWGAIFDQATVNAPAYSLFTGFLSFVLVFAMGLGVVIWLLEEEHDRASTVADEIAQLAFHDPLTGLPTRKLLLDHLGLAIPQARRDKVKLAVIFIDLDRFKNINDSLGHSAGDRVLQTIANRVKCVLREADTVARMGGDEFVVLAPDINGIDDTVHVAQKVRDAIREPMQVEGRELFVSCSMGIALYPNDGDEAELLLKNADTAMYRAKSQGSDLFQLYTPQMNAHAVEQLALETALRRAVESFEFELHYQPIVRTGDGHICTLEAMLRWRHPVLGLVRPEQFLPLAESSGMIVPIGEWTLRTACKQLSDLRLTGYPELRMAVNISSRELKQPDFVDKVRIVLAEQALPASAVELEITEMSATQSETAIIERLRVLREMGVRISIDDFGTGFSSVSVLRVFPVDSLKIDTSFVRDLVLDPNDAAIAAAVVALAKSMGLEVVAEGVENPSQLEFLRAHGCEMWQGYLCCPPVVSSELRTVLGRRSGSSVKRIRTPLDSEIVKR